MGVDINTQGSGGGKGRGYGTVRIMGVGLGVEGGRGNWYNMGGSGSVRGFVGNSLGGSMSKRRTSCDKGSFLFLRALSTAPTIEVFGSDLQ